MRPLAFLGLIGLTLALALTNPLNIKVNSAPATLPGTSIKLSESAPWHITNLVVFEAQPNKNCSSYISFDFEDKNAGLALNTTCMRTVKSGSLASPRYQSCESDYVSFVYEGEKLTLEHLYRDESIGAFPYDGAIAFGHANFTNVTRVKVEGGVLRTQTQMFVPITSLSG